MISYNLVLYQPPCSLDVTSHEKKKKINIGQPLDQILQFCFTKLSKFNLSPFEFKGVCSFRESRCHTKPELNRQLN